MESGTHERENCHKISSLNIFFNLPVQKCSCLEVQKFDCVKKYILVFGKLRKSSVENIPMLQDPNAKEYGLAFENRNIVSVKRNLITSVRAFEQFEKANNRGDGIPMAA